MPSPRGHRSLPHTADTILEAWGPTLPTCLEEAVGALVATYIDVTGARPVEVRALHVPPAPPDRQLLDVLDEVVFLLDTEDAVPAGATVRHAPDGGLDVGIVLADAGSVEPTGAVPKAVSRSELAVASDGDGIRCRFLVDV